MASNWTSKKTRKGQLPRNRRRGNQNKKLLPKTKKDQLQDRELENIKKKVKRLEGEPELKVKDAASTIEAVADPLFGSSGIVLINGLQQGTSHSQRIGDEVMFTSLQFRGNIITAPATLASEIVRIIIYYDKMSLGNAAVLQEVLDNTVITAPVYSPYQSDYYGRFKILYDETFALNPQLALTSTLAGAVTSTTTTMRLTYPFQGRVKLNKKANYGLNNLGTESDIAQGAIYVMALGQQNTASTSNPTVVIGTRLIYKDI